MQRVLEHVAEMQLAGHVRRGKHDAERASGRIGIRLEIPLLHPVRRPLLLERPGLEGPRPSSLTANRAPKFHPCWIRRFVAADCTLLRGHGSRLQHLAAVGGLREAAAGGLADLKLHCLCGLGDHPYLLE